MATGPATLGERPDGDGRVGHLPTAPAVSMREIHTMSEGRVGRPLNVVVLPEARPLRPVRRAVHGRGLKLSDQRAAEQRRQDILAAARQSALSFTSLDYRHYDRDSSDVLKGATGEFKKEFAAQTAHLKREFAAQTAQLTEPQIMDSSAFERAFGATPARSPRRSTPRSPGTGSGLADR